MSTASIGGRSSNAIPGAVTRFGPAKETGLARSDQTGLPAWQNSNTGYLAVIKEDVIEFQSWTPGQTMLDSIPNTVIEPVKASTYLARAPRNHFDIVLADPPYELADEAVAEMVEALKPTLRHGAVVVVERHRESPETAWPKEFTPTGQKLKKRLYGIARMDMAVYEDPEVED